MRTKNRQIWKFQFPVQDDIEIEMPMDAEVLHVEVQGEMPCLWAQVDPSLPRVKRQFHLYGTGHHMHNTPQQHVGSFQMHGGALVFHLFEVI